MSSTISPNMSLVVPGVGTEPGPTWANDLNASLGILDQHNHTFGQGVQIPVAGLNINADLPMNGNNLVAVQSVNFESLSSPLTGAAPNLGCIYVSGNEIYYNDEAGNQVQITNGGSVNAGAGSITGLPSGTASASYSSGSGTFVWQSATSTPANLDAASVIIREDVASGNGVTLSAPSGLAANYSLVFPSALPGSTSFVTIDTSGNIADSVSTIGGIITTNLANLSVTTAKIANAAVGVTQLAQPFASYGASGTIFTTSGTYTVPTGVTQVSVFGCGGGGGGGGGAATNSTGQGTSGGGGGGGAAIFEGIIPVTSGASITVTIGAGGNGGGGHSGASDGNGTNGSNGSNTTFGALLTINGGLGGGGGIFTAGTGSGSGGIGASLSRGTHNGGAGAAGAAALSSATAGGAGGTAYTVSMSNNGGGNGGTVAGGSAESGGGGGSGSVGVGTAGGAGSVATGATATNAAANSGGGGGGGGAGRAGGGGTGGNGGSGYLVVYVV